MLAGSKAAPASISARDQSPTGSGALSSPCNATSTSAPATSSPEDKAVMTESASSGAFVVPREKRARDTLPRYPPRSLSTCEAQAAEGSRSEIPDRRGGGRSRGQRQIEGESSRPQRSPARAASMSALARTSRARQCARSPGATSRANPECLFERRSRGSRARRRPRLRATTRATRAISTLRCPGRGDVRAEPEARRPSPDVRSFGPRPRARRRRREARGALARAPLRLGRQNAWQQSRPHSSSRSARNSSRSSPVIGVGPVRWAISPCGSPPDRR